MLTYPSVCLVSILRLQSLIAISNSLDPTYDNPPAATWSSVEVNIGIICSCLPLLRPLGKRWLPNVTSSYKRKTKGQDRTYAKMGSRKDLEPAASPQEYNLSSLGTKSLITSSHTNPAWNIQVVTDIQVQIEGNKEAPRNFR